MARWADMNGAARGGVGAAVAVVVAMAVLVAVQGRGPKPPPDDPAALVSAGEPAAEPVAAPALAPDATAVVDPAADAGIAEGTAAAPSPTAVAALLAPTIDVLRVAPDGLTTLAGRTEALAKVSVLVDGAEVALVGATVSGQFATVFTMPPSTAARMMTLVATLADGSRLAGAEAVAIAPVIQPVVDTQIASAGTQAAPAAATAAEPAADPAAPATDPATGTAVAPVVGAIAETAVDPTAPAAIKVTESGAEVVQPATPVPADLAAEVSLDVISYGADGAVQLGGTGAAGSAVRLYLDTVETATTTVAEDGKWSVTSASIAPGVYTLRIDQLDAAGKVTSRLETPFKRETLEALAEAAAPAKVVPEQVAVAEPAIAQDAATKTDDMSAKTGDTLAKAGDTSAKAGEVIATAVEPSPAAPATAEDATPEPAPAEPTALAAAAPATLAPGADPAPDASAAPITVTVQPGFTLWAIAKQNFGNGVMYVQVFEANKDKIKDPDLIYPGQVLSVPASP